MIRVQIQSEAMEDALDLIRSAISAEISRMELGLRATERHIRTFEERYHVTSEVSCTPLRPRICTRRRGICGVAGELKTARPELPLAWKH